MTLPFVDALTPRPKLNRATAKGQRGGALTCPLTREKRRMFPDEAQPLSFAIQSPISGRGKVMVVAPARTALPGMP